MFMSTLLYMRVSVVKKKNSCSYICRKVSLHHLNHNKPNSQINLHCNNRPLCPDVKCVRFMFILKKMHLERPSFNTTQF